MLAHPTVLYDANLDNIYFSTAERKIILNGIGLTPRYNRTDFYKETGEAGDILYAEI